MRLGNEVPGLPAYEYLSTESESFALYADARANRRDPFYISPPAAPTCATSRCRCGAPKEEL